LEAEKNDLIRKAMPKEYIDLEAAEVVEQPKPAPGLMIQQKKGSPGFRDRAWCLICHSDITNPKEMTRTHCQQQVHTACLKKWFA